MRMWMIHPTLLCSKHLCGEHNEIHKHKHNFIKQHSIQGRLQPIVQIEPGSMKKRHDELAKHLNHKSPYTQPDINYLPIEQQNAKVDINKSYIDLIDRCAICRENIKKYALRR